MPADDNAPLPGALEPPGILHDLRRAIERIEDAQADVVLSPDGTVVIWNKRMERLFGWTKDEAVGQPLDTLILPDRYAAAHRAGLARYRQTGKSQILCRRLMVEGKRKDGTEIPLTLIAMVVPYQVDSYRFLGFINILDREKAESRD